MKKLFISVSALAIIGLASSCKKEYTCECTMTSGGFSTTASTTIEDKKADAEDKCTKENGTTEENGVEVTLDCKLK